MTTLITAAEETTQMTTAVVFNFVRVSENIWIICLEDFHRVRKVCRHSAAVC